MENSKKNTILAILAIAAIILTLAVLFLTQNNKLPRDNDTEFKNGSKIQISFLSDTQTESLYKLCKVWGYTKYYHPSVISGDLNWDAELFRVMPKILKSKDFSETNRILFDWLEQFPFKIEKTESTKNLEQLQSIYGQQLPDTDWIKDTSFLGTDLSNYLCELSKNITAHREHSYAVFKNGLISFEHENMYPVSDTDSGMKLLGLFRFWNMYEYYSPYVKITTKDWDEVLLESIPNVATAQDYRSYVLAIAQVTAMTGDAHMTLTDKYGILRSYYGNYYLPCSILIIDGQAVVEQTAHTENQLLPGDILLEIDGMPVESRIRELSQYLVLPQPDKILKKLGDSLLQTKGTSAEIVVLRNHKMISLQVTTDINAYSYQNPFKNGFLNEENIGYIDPSALKEGDLEKLMDKFRDTRVSL